MPIETAILTAAPAVLPLAVRSAQIGFEIHQAPKEIGDLLKTVKGTRHDISRAQQRRIVLAKRGCRNLTEHDDAIREVEKALADLEILVERARIDLEHNDGKLRSSTKWLWFLRDARSRSVAYDRLALAYLRPPFSALLQVEQENVQFGLQHAQAEAPPPYTSHHESTKTSLAELRTKASRRLLRPEPPSVEVRETGTAPPKVVGGLDPHDNSGQGQQLLTPMPSFVPFNSTQEAARTQESTPSKPSYLYNPSYERLPPCRKSFNHSFSKREEIGGRVDGTNPSVRQSKQNPAVRGQPADNTSKGSLKHMKFSNPPMHDVQKGRSRQDNQQQLHPAPSSNQNRTYTLPLRRSNRSVSDPNELFLPPDNVTTARDTYRNHQRTVSEGATYTLFSRDEGATPARTMTMAEPRSVATGRSSQHHQRQHTRAQGSIAHLAPPYPVSRQSTLRSPPRNTPYEQEDTDDEWWNEDDAEDRSRY